MGGSVGPGGGSPWPSMGCVLSKKGLKKRRRNGPSVHGGEAPWAWPRTPTGPGGAKSNNRWLHLPRREILRTLVPPSLEAASSTWWFRPDRREQKAPQPQTPPCGTQAPCSPTDWLTAAAGVASHFAGSCLDSGLSQLSMLCAVWCEMEFPQPTNQKRVPWVTTVESRLCSLVVLTRVYSGA